ncbi:MAG: hypothetical protein L0H29_08750, partial [Sinobacteraceae bacterium]|nr:hypothetical protein [Nevskiaceae bacterium]
LGRKRRGCNSRRQADAQTRQPRSYASSLRISALHEGAQKARTWMPPSVGLPAGIGGDLVRDAD